MSNRALVKGPDDQHWYVIETATCQPIYLMDDVYASTVNLPRYSNEVWSEALELAALDAAIDADSTGYSVVASYLQSIDCIERARRAGVN